MRTQGTTRQRVELFDEDIQGVTMPMDRNTMRHASPPQNFGQAQGQGIAPQGHWDPFGQKAQRAQTVGIWTNGWRVIRRHPTVIDYNCWEVSRPLNGRYTQYIQIDLKKAEVRVFVHDMARIRQRVQSVEGSFHRFTLGSVDQIRMMVQNDPMQLQKLVLKQFGGLFTVK